MIPRYIFFDFNSLKFPFLGFWVIHIGYLQEYNLDFFHLKYIYLFMKNLTHFREKLETGVDTRLSSILASWNVFITWRIRAQS